jgi:hypothetical protein
MSAEVAGANVSRRTPYGRNEERSTSADSVTVAMRV